MPIKPFEHNWAAALYRIRDNGPEAWREGFGRAGGTISRMFERMVGEGLCTKAPHTITEKGKQWLADYEHKPHSRICARCRMPRGCIPLWHKGVQQYYHLPCFNQLRAEEAAQLRKRFGLPKLPNMKARKARH